MIGWLSGTLRSKQPPQLILDVNGVGYEVEAPMTTFYELPQTEEKVALFIHHVVREDAQLLYGFGRESERALFRALIKVNGVGPKLALAILSGMDAAQFGQCVQQEDSAALTRLPGVGKRTAERLIVEMRDRLEKSEGLAPLPVPTGAAADPTTPGDPREEAISALIALGYKPPEAAKRVRAVANDGDSCEEIIRHALRSMVK